MVNQIMKMTFCSPLSVVMETGMNPTIYRAAT
jgi:hypothetical protein